jgi:hypothetical protein
VALQVAAGRATCSRCELPIVTGQRWDLDHRDNGAGYRGPSHQDCNRRAPALRQKYSEPVDDPERGIYWSSPDAKGRHARWSRPWFDWRAE